VHHPVGQAEDVAEREEGAHRPQVAGVLAGLDLTKAAGRGPHARDLAEEANGLDVQVDLGVGGRLPWALQERDREREQRQACADVPRACSHRGRRLASARVTAPLIARAALVLLAVSAAVVLVAFQRSEDACTDSVKAMFFALRDRVPDAQLDPTVAAVEDDCPGSGRLVDAGAVLFQQGHPEQAESVLWKAVEREPKSFSAWAGLASILAESDPAKSAEAAGIARRLNPFYRPPS
jgi:hypothetical protein